MTNTGLDLKYEAARTWALHPVAHPPSGWAPIMRRGIAFWVHQPHCSTARVASAHGLVRHRGTPLLTVIAAMIAQVCR